MLPRWKLVEIVQNSVDSFDGPGVAPLQLFTTPGSAVDPKEGSILVVGGFEGPLKNDGHIVSLMQRATSTNLFAPMVDVSVVPLINPSSKGRRGAVTATQVDLHKAFTDSPEALRQSKSLEVKTLVRWFQQVAPKIVVTLSGGVSAIRHLNAPPDLLRRLCEHSELKAYVVGTEPQETDRDGNLTPRIDLSGSFGVWAQSQNMIWIDLVVDNKLKTFDEVRDLVWKTSLGPLLKWLCEGNRLIPEKVEAAPEVPSVIPVLEIPPELLHP